MSQPAHTATVAVRLPFIHYDDSDSEADSEEREYYREKAVLMIHQELVKHQYTGAAHCCRQDGVGDRHGDDLSVT
mgnify:FL=1